MSKGRFKNRLIKRTEAARKREVKIFGEPPVDDTDSDKFKRWFAKKVYSNFGKDRSNYFPSPQVWDKARKEDLHTKARMARFFPELEAQLIEELSRDFSKTSTLWNSRPKSVDSSTLIVGSHIGINPKKSGGGDLFKIDGEMYKVSKGSSVDKLEPSPIMYSRPLADKINFTRTTFKQQHSFFTKTLASNLKEVNKEETRGKELEAILAAAIEGMSETEGKKLSKRIKSAEKKINREYGGYLSRKKLGKFGKANIEKAFAGSTAPGTSNDKYEAKFAKKIRNEHLEPLNKHFGALKAKNKFLASVLEGIAEADSSEESDDKSGVHYTGQLYLPWEGPGRFTLPRMPGLGSGGPLFTSHQKHRLDDNTMLRLGAHSDYPSQNLDSVWKARAKRGELVHAPSFNASQLANLSRLTGIQITNDNYPFYEDLIYRKARKKNEEARRARSLSFEKMANDVSKRIEEDLAAMRAKRGLRPKKGWSPLGTSTIRRRDKGGAVRLLARKAVGNNNKSLGKIDVGGLSIDTSRASSVQNQVLNGRVLGVESEVSSVRSEEVKAFKKNWKSAGKEEKKLFAKNVDERYGADVPSLGSSLSSINLLSSEQKLPEKAKAPVRMPLRIPEAVGVGVRGPTKNTKVTYTTEINKYDGKPFLKKYIDEGESDDEIIAKDNANKIVSAKIPLRIAEAVGAGGQARNTRNYGGNQADGDKSVTDLSSELSASISRLKMIPGGRKVLREKIAPVLIENEFKRLIAERQRKWVYGDREKALDDDKTIRDFEEKHKGHLPSDWQRRRSALIDSGLIKAREEFEKENEIRKKEETEDRLKEAEYNRRRAEADKHTDDFISSTDKLIEKLKRNQAERDARHKRNEEKERALEERRRNEAKEYKSRLKRRIEGTHFRGGPENGGDGGPESGGDGSGDSEENLGDISYKVAHAEDLLNDIDRAVAHNEKVKNKYGDDPSLMSDRKKRYKKVPLYTYGQRRYYADKYGTGTDKVPNDDFRQRYYGINPDGTRRYGIADDVVAAKNAQEKARVNKVINMTPEELEKWRRDALWDLFYAGINEDTLDQDLNKDVIATGKDFNNGAIATGKELGREKNARYKDFFKRDDLDRDNDQNKQATHGVKGEDYYDKFIEGLTLKEGEPQELGEKFKGTNYFYLKNKRESANSYRAYPADSDEEILKEIELINGVFPKASKGERYERGEINTNIPNNKKRKPDKEEYDGDAESDFDMPSIRKEEGEKTREFVQLLKKKKFNIHAPIKEINEDFERRKNDDDKDDIQKGMAIVTKALQKADKKHYQEDEINENVHYGAPARQNYGGDIPEYNESELDMSQIYRRERGRKKKIRQGWRDNWFEGDSIDIKLNEFEEGLRYIGDRAARHGQNTNPKYLQFRKNQQDYKKRMIETANNMRSDRKLAHEHGYWFISKLANIPQQLSLQERRLGNEARAAGLPAYISKAKIGEDILERVHYGYPVFKDKY